MKDTHVLQQRFGFSLAEIYAMTPWELDVRQQMILIDQDQEKERVRKNPTQW